MAYSDWGAFVSMNGTRRTDREDVGVFEEGNKLPSGMRIFANLMENKAHEGQESPWWKHSHHAVLGDGDLRLCAYKSRPELWLRIPATRFREEAVIQIPLECMKPSEDSYHEDHGCEWDGMLNGYSFDVFEWWRRDNEHGACQMLTLHLTEPDGTVWDATAGSMYGAGHKDVSRQETAEILADPEIDGNMVMWSKG